LPKGGLPKVHLFLEVKREWRQSVQRGDFGLIVNGSFLQRGKGEELHLPRSF